MTTVEINPDTRAQFLEPTFSKYPGFEQQLVAEFKYCKDRNITTDIFGNDAAFTFPSAAVDAQLFRIHIKLPGEKPWPPGTTDFKKTSDTYLIYAQHMWEPTHYSIMGVVTPAHTLMSSRNTQLIVHFAECAEQFHSR